MSCFHPYVGFRLGQKFQLHKPFPGDEAHRFRIPCGGCLGCRLDRARQWALRCQLEAEVHDRAAFVTLTYDEAHVPPTLRKDHLVRWLDRLRYLSAVRFRFFACGEYGDLYQRPHFHALLFGMSDPSAIREAWTTGTTRKREPRGIVSVDPVTPRSIAYVAGYAAKKIGWAREPQERLDRETGELYTWQPPFVHMSRNPGIGAWARAHPASWKSYAIHQGRRVPVPPYLHKAWKDQAHPDEIAQLEAERLQRPPRDLSRERLDAAEAVAQAKHNIQSTRRKLA